MVIFRGVNFYPRQIESLVLKQSGVGHEYQIVLDRAPGGSDRLALLIEAELYYLAGVRFRSTFLRRLAGLIFLLQLADLIARTETRLEEIARTVHERFPRRFPRWEDALARAADLAQEYS